MTCCTFNLPITSCIFVSWWDIIVWCLSIICVTDNCLFFLSLYFYLKVWLKTKCFQWFVFDAPLLLRLHVCGVFFTVLCKWCLPETIFWSFRSWTIESPGNRLHRRHNTSKWRVLCIYLTSTGSTLLHHCVHQASLLLNDNLNKWQLPLHLQSSQ